QWLGVDRDLRKPWVLTDYARTTGHLAEGTPGPGSTGVHEKGCLPRPPDVARPGHIPVLGFADTTLEQHAEEVAEICRWAAEHAPAAELDQPRRAGGGNGYLLVDRPCSNAGLITCTPLPTGHSKLSRRPPEAAARCSAVVRSRIAR